MATNRQFAEAISLSKEFNLVGAGTAFVAWDEVEKVIVAAEEVYQPALEPAGWMDKAAGGFLLSRASAPTARDCIVGLMEMQSESLFCLHDVEEPLRRSRPAGKQPAASTPPWAQETLFLEPGGDLLLALINAWLDGNGFPARRLAEARLRRLIKAVTGETGRLPSEQLAELARRLPALLGTTGRYALELSELRVQFGW